MARVRLNRYLAMSGVASRRQCEHLVEAGRVRLNGVLVVELATTVETATDRVEVDGTLVRPLETVRVLVLNKPAGFITTLRDPQGRRTVADLMPESPRLYPVGRLDADTTGLLLLTDDGELAFRVMHPRYGLRRRYLVLVQGAVRAPTLATLVRGVLLDDGPAAALEARCVATDGVRSVLRLTLGEGRKREVRRLCRKAGHRVVKLHRESFGPIDLGDVREGATRELGAAELARLRAAIGLEAEGPTAAAP